MNEFVLRRTTGSGMAFVNEDLLDDERVLNQMLKYFFAIGFILTSVFRNGDCKKGTNPKVILSHLLALLIQQVA